MPLGNARLAKDLQPSALIFTQAGWQFDCFQAEALRELVHIGNVRLGEQFAALESPMAYVVCIST